MCATVSTTGFQAWESVKREKGNHIAYATLYASWDSCEAVQSPVAGDQDRG